MLSIDQLTFQYTPSSFRLTIPTFTAPPAAATALVGPSGCGKTTLLQLAAGILTPDTGSVLLNGAPVPSDPAFRLQRIGLIFQEFELVPHLSVLDNIRLPFLLGLRTSEYDPHNLADLVGIAHHLKKLPGELSQGERQRVAICRALIIKPSLILADEPTGNLDPSNKKSILDLLISTAEEQQCPLVVATHDHELLSSFDYVHSFSDLTQS